MTRGKLINIIFGWIFIKISYKYFTIFLEIFPRIKERATDELDELKILDWFFEINSVPFAFVIIAKIVILLKQIKMDVQWLQSDEAKHISDDVKSKAWKEFKRKYQ